MQFDVKLHKETPEGFNRVTKGLLIENDYSRTRGTELSKSTNTYYQPTDFDFDIYGLKLDGSHASLSTEFSPVKGILRRRSITKQEAKFTLAFDVVYHAYERHESQKLHATVGSTNDPEKVEAVKRITEELAKKFTDYEVDHTAGAGLISIAIKDPNADPLKEFSKIKNALQEIKQQYDAGAKPLGDIPEPKGTPRPNRRSEGVMPKFRGENYQERLEREKRALVIRILGAARDTFHNATDADHQDFAKKIRQLIDRGKGGRS